MSLLLLTTWIIPLTSWQQLLQVTIVVGHYHPPKHTLLLAPKVHHFKPEHLLDDVVVPKAVKIKKVLWKTLLLFTHLSMPQRGSVADLVR